GSVLNRRWWVKIKSALTQDQLLTIALDDIPSGQSYTLSLFDDHQRLVGQAAEDEKRSRRPVSVQVEKDRWYYIAVAGAGDAHDKTGYYRLRVCAVPAKPNVQPDRFEPNNGLGEVSPITGGGSLAATIHHQDDTDYYMFDVKLASMICATLAVDQSGKTALELTLLDERGRLLAQIDTRKDKSPTLRFHGDPGTYYLKVAPRQHSPFSAQSYRLTGRTATIPVILIPGIGGSRLMATEAGQVTEAWLDIEDMPLDYIQGVHRRVLPLVPVRAGSVEMVQRAPEVTITPEAGDAGFRATAFLSYNPLVQKHAEQYHSMAEYLEKMGYIKGVSLFAFPYDWRKSSTENAGKLKRQIDEVLARSRSQQVQLVAHSMGGLLARETLLAYPAYQSKIRRIVYLGTPFLGAPRAYQAIKFGYNFGIPVIFSQETGRQIAEYSPAVYELLPSREYVRKQTYLYMLPDLYTPDTSKRQPLEYERIYDHPAARLPYIPLVQFGDKLQQKWNRTPLSVSQYSIVGQGQITLSGYEIMSLNNQHVPFYDLNGDGTVPFISANHALAGIRRTYYVREKHAALPSNPDVIQQVALLLSGSEQIQKGMSAVPVKKAAFDYYLLYRRDGAFPDAAIQTGNKVWKTREIRNNQQQVSGEFEIEFHGNVIVLLPKAGGDPPAIRVTPEKGVRASEEGGIMVEKVHSGSAR
ncbi:MAG: esterase, partial [Brevibacillus sp.]|nr:esterase [Brevibacillus sp.]